MNGAPRVLRVQRALEPTACDVLALVPGPNLTYASGVPVHRSERLTLFVIPREGDPIALAPALEANVFRDAGIRCYAWRDEDGPKPALARLVEEHRFAQATWGIESNTATYGEVQTIRAAAPDVTVIPADEVLARLRMVKDERELQALRRAAALTIEALRAGIQAVRAGTRERDVAAVIQVALLRGESEGPSFAPLVAGGPNSANPHAHSGDRVFRAGDMVIIDCGATADGYQGDITRCVTLAPIDDELRRIYDVAREAAAAGRAAVQPGIPAEQVDRATRQVIDDAGYGDYFTHRTGHGIGLEIHEPPYIVAGNRQLLEPGMVFSVEPGIYLPTVGGVRVEDVVVVTEAGCEVLTAFPRELFKN